ncbi:hypothetical protein HID58_090489 [Brassica napus]|uniref:Uncharacterized protein n=1 Tax=Brassica napus TaxID=3708 RepID=A0ABQ7WYM8_BRANA|nr:uncharacterized protein LOC106396916 [Brassica napus]KAH0847134.1 hypothetical protein HID58_090489 [Brassica napus]
MDRTHQPESTTRPGNTVVLSIDCLKGSSKSDEWSGDMLQTGDIVEEIRIGSGPGSAIFKAPFKGGKAWLQKVLHNSYRNKDTSIVVRVRRGSHDLSDLSACIVPNDSAGKKQYMLRSIDDPNYTVGFSDRTESDCLGIQASRGSRMVEALVRAKLQDGYVSYPWERRMQEALPISGSSNFLSILFLPKASAYGRAGSRYNDLEDTLARANAWLSCSQANGVPIVFMNIQTESLLTKISGETASATVNTTSLSDLSNLANASLYGFEDYHGVDIGVVRAVRLWYAPLGVELPIEIKLRDDDTKLGFSISRTEEVCITNGLGFIYVSSVTDHDDESAPAARSGLSSLYRDAAKASRRLVVSRVGSQKVLPWMVSSTGAIRCYDTVSLSQKLSLHRHAKVSIVLHVILWDSSATAAFSSPPRSSTHLLFSNETLDSMEFSQLREALPPRQVGDRQVMPLADDQDVFRFERENAGNASFKFQEIPFTNESL